MIVLLEMNSGNNQTAYGRLFKRWQIGSSPSVAREALSCQVRDALHSSRRGSRQSVGLTFAVTSTEKAKSKQRLAEKAMFGAWRPPGTCVDADRIQGCLNACSPQGSPQAQCSESRMSGCWAGLDRQPGQTAWEPGLPSSRLRVVLDSKHFSLRALLLSRMMHSWNALLSALIPGPVKQSLLQYCRSLPGGPHSKAMLLKMCPRHVEY